MKRFKTSLFIVNNNGLKNKSIQKPCVEETIRYMSFSLFVKSRKIQRFTNGVDRAAPIKHHTRPFTKAIDGHILFRGDYNG